MKTLFKSLMALMVVGALTTACKKETKTGGTTPPPSTSQLVLEGQSFTLDKGILENYGTDTSFYEGTNFDINLLTSDIKLHYDSNGEIDSVSGNGYVVYFETFSSGTNDLAPGTYTYNANSLKEGTFDVGAIYQIINGEPDPNDDNVFEITSGNLEVSKTGSNYSLSGTFNADQNGVAKTVKVNYNGALTMD